MQAVTIIIVATRLCCYRQEDVPASAKRQKHGASSATQHGSPVNQASNCVGLRQSFAMRSSTRGLSQSGVSRSRELSARSSRHTVAGTAASRSVVRTLRRRSRSSFTSPSSPPASRYVSVSSVTDSSINGISVSHVDYF